MNPILNVRHFDNIGDFAYEKTISNTIGLPYGQVYTKDGGFVVLTSDNNAIQLTKLDCQGNTGAWNSDCSYNLLNEIQVHLYPNPATEVLKINAKFDIEKIKIFNLLGEEIRLINVCECNRATVGLKYVFLSKTK